VSGSALPLADAASFARRTRLVHGLRLAAAATVAAAALAGLGVAHGLRATPSPLLPPDASGIIVLDLSASISTDTYARIAGTLGRLVRSDGRYGLILFSDTAYQALPPGTPASELRAFRRFFAVPPRTEPGALPEVPPTPWAASFSGGTRISTGLELALDVVRAERLRRPAVLLVSDLDDDTADLDRVARVAAEYRRARIPLHVVGLNADPEDAEFVRGLVPTGGSFTPAALPDDGGLAIPRGATSWLLVAIAVLLTVALVLYLPVGLRLRWTAGS
jgi:hypothetical protein